MEITLISILLSGGIIFGALTSYIIYDIFIRKEGSYLID